MNHEDFEKMYTGEPRHVYWEFQRHKYNLRKEIQQQIKNLMDSMQNVHATNEMVKR